MKAENPTVLCEVDSENNLQLKQTMNMFGDRDKNDLDSIVQGIWKYHVKSNIER